MVHRENSYDWDCLKFILSVFDIFTTVVLFNSFGCYIDWLIDLQNWLIDLQNVFPSFVRGLNLVFIQIIKPFIALVDWFKSMTISKIHVIRRLMKQCLMIKFLLQLWIFKSKFLQKIRFTYATYICCIHVICSTCNIKLPHICISNFSILKRNT